MVVEAGFDVASFDVTPGQRAPLLEKAMAWCAAEHHITRWARTVTGVWADADAATIAAHAPRFPTRPANPYRTPTAPATPPRPSQARQEADDGPF